MSSYPEMASCKTKGASKVDDWDQVETLPYWTVFPIIIIIVVVVVVSRCFCYSNIPLEFPKHINSKIST
jgi:uncharacterized membrane protein